MREKSVDVLGSVEKLFYNKSIYLLEDFINVKF